MDVTKFTQKQMDSLRKVFHAMNRLMVFMWRIGLGKAINVWPAGFGRILVIKHRGRKSGVDSDFARAEGEGDLSLNYWREAHKNYFSRVHPKIGKEFSEEMPLVCERFRVIHK